MWLHLSNHHTNPLTKSLVRILIVTWLFADQKIPPLVLEELQLLKLSEKPPTTHRGSQYRHGHEKVEPRPAT